MSSLSIRNMDWTVGLRELIVENREISWKRANEISQKIKDLLSSDDWYEWLATTPDDNAGYLAAAEAKLAELVGGARAVSMTSSVAQNGGK